MKHLIRISIFSMFSFLMLSCSQKNESVVEQLDLTAQINISIKDQVPQASFDTSAEGIYHGIIASGTTQSRGKVWINIGNDTQYNALVEMVGGEVYNLSLLSSNTSNETNPSVYEFKGMGASFILDVTNPRTPIITEAILNNDPYFSRVVKSRNQNRAMSKTGTFAGTGGSNFSGTWNLISDGTVINAPNYNGEAITEAAISFNGNMYIDNTFNTFDSTSCWLDPDMVPVLNLQGNPNYLTTEDQTTTIGSYTVSWNLSYQANFYYNYLNCEGRGSGIFTAVNGTITKEGEIYID